MVGWLVGIDVLGFGKFGKSFFVGVVLFWAGIGM